jgi:hypothetical protein
MFRWFMPLQNVKKWLVEIILIYIYTDQVLIMIILHHTLTWGMSKVPAAWVFGM